MSFYALRFQVCTVVHQRPVKLPRVRAVQCSQELLHNIRISYCVGISKEMIEVYRSHICFDKHTWPIIRVGSNRSSGVLSYTR